MTPLGIERAAVRRSLPGALVVRSGMGAVRARSAALLAACMPADAIAVAGFCGAVAGILRAGDVVVASEIRGPAGSICCDAGPVVAALATLGIERIHVGPVVSVDHVVHGAERRALADRGAMAADMESAWLARAAEGRPIAVLRVVLDAPAREIHRPLVTLAGGVSAWRALRRAAPALALWADTVVTLSTASDLLEGINRSTALQIEVDARSREVAAEPGRMSLSERRTGLSPGS
jgi:4-hydroxy-3-methylbut-2-enyl diphosphate reductase